MQPSPRPSTPVSSHLTRLLAATAVASILVITLGIVAFRETRVGGPIYGQILQDQVLIADILPPPLYAVEAYLESYRMVHATTLEARQQSRDRLATLDREFKEREVYWQGRIADPQLAEAFLGATMRTGGEVFRLIRDEVAPASEADRRLEASDLLQTRLDPAFRQHADAVSQAVARAQALTAENERRAQATVAQFTTWLLLAAGLGALGVGGFAWWTRRCLGAELTRATGELAEAVAGTAESAQSLAASSQQLADDASSQAAALEETSSSLQEISATVAGVSEQARLGQTASRQARQSAQNGAAGVEAANRANARINTAAAEVGRFATELNSVRQDITHSLKTIDEIAFQTNLLALNAAVEAARAGQHGAGFAVVADEVRSLAHRSSEAARAVSARLERLNDVARRGDELARHIGTASGEMLTSTGALAQQLEAIVRDSGETDRINEQVALSAAEQETGVVQIREAITQMERTTQAGAALAEETAGAAGELNSHADSLRQVVGRLEQLVGRASARAATTLRGPAPVASPPPASAPDLPLAGRSRRQAEPAALPR